MKSKFRIIFSFLTMSLIITIFSLNFIHVEKKENIKISGSSLLNQFFNYIDNSYLNSYSLSLSESSSTSGISNVLNGNSDIAIVDRYLTEDEKEILKNKNIGYYRYASDHYALVTNSKNNVQNLNSNDVEKIMKSKSMRWGEISKSIKDEKISKKFPETNLEYLDTLIKGEYKLKEPILNKEEKEGTLKISDFYGSFNSYKKIINDVEDNINSFSILPYSKVIYNDNLSISSWSNENLTEKNILYKKYSKSFPINIIFKTNNNTKKFIKILNSSEVKKNLYVPEKNIVFIP